MGIEFNPRKKSEETKGVGKIRLGGDEEKEAKEAAQKSDKRRKWLVVGVGSLALAVGLTGVFTMYSGRNAPDKPPTPVVETYQPPANTGPQITQQDANSIRAESIRAKESVIYRDDSRVYRDDSNARGEAYIGANGLEVQRGQDFAVHVQLFDQGAISVLVASGPYAGSRIEFTPVGTRGTSSITYTKVGQENIGADGSTVRFEALSASARTTQTVSMKSPATMGSGVSVPDNAAEFEKIVREGGESLRAFTVYGSPQEDGVFSIAIWNGDVYTVDLKTGQYSVDSVFLYHPNYQEEYQRTGVEVSRDDIPVVKGVLTVAPAHTPSAPVNRTAPAGLSNG